MNDSLNECRRDFEGWAEGHFVRLPHYEFFVLHKVDGERYHYPNVQQSWVAWKACWELCNARVEACLV